MPVAKAAGDKVIGGTVNQTGSFLMTAEKVGSDTVLAQIIDMVAVAQRSRAPIQKLADQVVQENGSAVIYPEGTRARQGVLGTFKPKGTVALLEQAPKTPVIPVCIDNSWRILMHKMMPIPWGIQLRCWIGDPIEREPGEDPYRLLEEIERQIRAAMARFRSEQVLTS